MAAERFLHTTNTQTGCWAWAVARVAESKKHQLLPHFHRTCVCERKRSQCRTDSRLMKQIHQSFFRSPYRALKGCRDPQRSGVHFLAYRIGTLGTQRPLKSLWASGSLVCCPMNLKNDSCRGGTNLSWVLSTPALNPGGLEPAD